MALSRLSIVLLLACLAAPGQAAITGPNIVMIIADDLGWNDVGYHGSEIATPNLDRLAAEGVRLDRFYVQSACSPTRSEIMTGVSAISLGVLAPFSKHQPAGLPLSQRILPQYFQDAGYQTFLVGKWHLGFRQPQYRPGARGFDHFYGYLTGGIGFWDHVHGGGLDWQRNGETVREEGYSTHLQRDEAVRLIRERDTGRPFFLYLSFNAPHLPNEAPEDALAPYAAIDNPDRRLHAGMVAEMDAAIGSVMGTLAEQGLADNTLVWFMSDNGGLNASTFPPRLVRIMSTIDDWFGERELPLRALEFVRVNMLYGAADNAPLRGGKQTVYEGGIRVPALVYWPGTLSASVQTGVITAPDVLPTLLAAAELPPVDAAIDGRSQWPALAGGAATQARDYHAAGLGSEALLRFPWKLVVHDPDEPELYRVDEDPFEQRDLSAEYPEQVTQLRRAMEATPRGERVNLAVWRVAPDPDFFGGSEDRPPWSELEKHD